MTDGKLDKQQKFYFQTNIYTNALQIHTCDRILFIRTRSDLGLTIGCDVVHTYNCCFLEYPLGPNEQDWKLIVGVIFVTPG